MVQQRKDRSPVASAGSSAKVGARTKSRTKGRAGNGSDTSMVRRVTDSTSDDIERLSPGFDLGSDVTRIVRSDVVMPSSPPIVATASAGPKIQRKEGDAAAKPNNTGMPDQLKAGIESLSGMSMDHVKVHYNSAKPAQLAGVAFSTGSEIHIAPGQEAHLPHEAWHVVQQAQGKVPAGEHVQGAPGNDPSLESEADSMGAKAERGGT